MKNLTCCLFLLVNLHATVTAQSPSLIGRWKIELTFSGGEEHALEFNAVASGKGTYLLLDDRSNLLPPPESAQAEWKQVGRRQVRVSGEIEFPIGNVGRNAGTLTLQGSFNSPDSISGAVSFYPHGPGPKDPRKTPAKTGRFTAKRVSAGR